MNALEESLLELKRAMEEIADLRKAQELARMEVDAAANALKEATDSRRTQHSAYSDKKFWDNRYSSPAEQIYEWYVSVDSFKRLLLDDYLSCHNLNDRELKRLVMLPGCGNSASAEELCNLGFRNVVGIDYSSEVVSAMQLRAEKMALPLRYFEGDARNLVGWSAESAALILDKGTLDAICSGDGNDGPSNAVAFFKEQWRLLMAGGLYVLVSTAPKEIIQDLVINHLHIEHCSNWRTCTYTPFTTAAGGTVYYYGIKKFCALPNEGSVRSTSEPSRTNFVADGISALLAEAKQILEDGSYEHSSASGEFDTDRGGDTESWEPCTRESSTAVKLIISSGDYAPGELVYIAVEIMNGNWHDGDCVGLISIDSMSDSRCLYPRIGPQFECFEYIDSPSDLIALRLPMYSGNFSFIYFRFVSKQVQVCGQSDAIHVNSIIFPSHPDICDSKVQSKLSRRRGVGLLKSPHEIKHRDSAHSIHFSSVVDYMQGISILKVLCRCSCPDLQISLQRLMCWLFVNGDGIVTIVCEMDVISWTKDLDCRFPSVSTICHELVFPELRMEIIDICQSSASINLGGLICIRLHLAEVFQCTTKLFSAYSTTTRDSYTIRCKFCGAHLTTENSISSVEHFPTGAFDEMMTEFICCENVSSHAVLSSGDIAPSEGTAVLGIVHLSVDPSITLLDLSAIQCKEFPSISDFVCASSTISIHSSTKSKSTTIDSCHLIESTSPRVIMIDTCSIGCPRCGLIIADAEFREDAKSLDISRSVSDLNIVSSDLRSIRFFLHRIELFSEEGCLASEMSLSSETAVARTLLFLVEHHSINTFCLYCKDSSFCLELLVVYIRIVSKSCVIRTESDDNQGMYRDGIRVSFAIANNDEGDKFPLKAKEARVNIPLDFDCFSEVTRVLTERSVYFEASVFSSQKMSVLCK